MKKIVMLFTLMLCVLCGAVAFAACGGPSHTHSYEYVYNNDATCTQDGTESYKCSCGDIIAISIKEGSALGHDFKDGFCTRCGKGEASAGLLYTPTADGEGYVAAGLGTCQEKDIVIASVYNEKPVKEIGAKAFEVKAFERANITSVKIPDTVVTIGDEAFMGCYNLTSINIPDSVTEIGDYVFQYCSGLTSVAISDSVTEIGDYVFQYCSGLTSVNLIYGQ